MKYVAKMWIIPIPLLYFYAHSYLETENADFSYCLDVA
jgi:hypothetical protein